MRSICAKKPKTPSKLPLPAQHDFARGFRHFTPGNVERNTELSGLLLEVRVPGSVLGAIPGVDGAVSEGEAFVGDDEIEIEVDGVAETLAARAGAEGIVEAEEARLGLLAGTMAAFCTRRLPKSEAAAAELERLLRRRAETSSKRTSPASR